METYSKKICLLGDFAVGKTSLVRRFVHNRFDDAYISTIGVKVSRKTVVLPYGQDIVEVKLMVWDLAGSQAFDSVAASYLRGSSGAILVCDLTRQETLDRLADYAGNLRNVMPSAQLVIAANKMDLVEHHQLTVEQVAKYAEQLGVPYYLTSAKVGDQVEQAFRDLAAILMQSSVTS
ncbi:MAG: GTP-binding protein [Caldilineaceae bacterium]|nr:GTP-binding protein [Caldilineaceae bacterium]